MLENRKSGPHASSTRCGTELKTKPMYEIDVKLGQAIYQLIYCVLLITKLSLLVEGLAYRNPVSPHRTSKMTVITPTDRPKSSWLCCLDFHFLIVLGLVS